MYKVVVFVALISVSHFSYGTNIDEPFSSKMSSSAQIKKEVIQLIEDDLNTIHKELINKLCETLLTEHLKKFKWLGNKNQQGKL